MQQSATIMHLFHEYNLSQPHMMCRDLRLICCTKYVLGFKEGSRMEAQFVRQYGYKGSISRFLHFQETLEQKSRIKSTVRSDLNSQAILISFGSVFSRKFISKD
ncbi:hypothetical protein DPMN_034476 [Dreissena polymorpha]|uniref:Uncharacterized protein n=1 Tax=Dreissena polymorpha TaxID=45954 RepID=A0A9D4M5S7_DREPO|nr:hypothetical protein DPMN_034476 [Dreissena polymorpha]